MLRRKDNKEKEMNKIEKFFKKVNVKIPEHLRDDYNIKMVTQNGYAIQHIKNPSKEIQKLAVTQDGFAIQYIQNPSKEIQKLAVTQNGSAIQYIKNPSEEVMELAVKQNKEVVQYFKREWFE